LREGTNNGWRLRALKFVRFTAVGLSSALLYVLLVSALLWFGSGPLVLIHCIAYALSIPYSYLAQRGFTFRSDRLHTIAFPRFLLTNALSFVLSTGIIALSAALDIPTATAVAAAVVVAPSINYLCMNGWVFPERTSASSP
jgi:putative flippase GtrA